MPPERLGGPRQEPVSCKLCRQRKLKCDRQYPCSNCSARSVTCIYKATDGPKATPTPAPSDAQSLEELRQETAQLKQRLSRLESLVLQSTGQHASIERTVTPTSGSGTPSGVQLDAHVTLDLSDAFKQSCPDDTVVRQFQDNIEALLKYNGPLARVPLPVYERALSMLDQYSTLLYPMHTFVFPPTLKATIDNVYTCVAQDTNPNEMDVALILIIFAVVVFYCHTASNTTGKCFKTNEDAMVVVHKWAKLAIDHVWPPTKTSTTNLQTIQVICHYYFLLHHMEGIQSAIVAMHSNAILLAKALGLHKIDMQKHTDMSREAIIEREIGRRMWWQLCATDWQLGSMSGPLEGTYLIHPKHMRVNLPRNISDEDLLIRDETFSRPHDEPTVAAYTLQRIRLGDACRRMIDVSCDGPRVLEPWEMEYDTVISLDGLFDKIAQEMPAFMRVGPDGCGDVDETTDTYQPTSLARNVANLMLWTRRMKLHLPFVNLVAQDGRYAYSTHVFLQSAKRMMWLRDTLQRSNFSDPIYGSRMQSMLRHLLHGMVMKLMSPPEKVNVQGKDGIPALGSETEKAWARRGDHAGVARTFLDSIKAMVDTYEMQLTTPVSMTEETDFTGDPGPLPSASSSSWSGMFFGSYLPDVDLSVTWEQLLS